MAMMIFADVLDVLKIVITILLSSEVSHANESNDRVQ